MDPITFRDEVLYLARYAQERARMALLDGLPKEAKQCRIVARQADELLASLVSLGLVKDEQS